MHYGLLFMFDEPLGLGFGLQQFHEKNVCRVMPLAVLEFLFVLSK